METREFYPRYSEFYQFFVSIHKFLSSFYDLLTQVELISDFIFFFRKHCLARRAYEIKGAFHVPDSVNRSNDARYFYLVNISRVSEFLFNLSFFISFLCVNKSGFVLQWNNYVILYIVYSVFNIFTLSGKVFMNSVGLSISDLICLNILGLPYK